MLICQQQAVNRQVTAYCYQSIGLTQIWIRKYQSFIQLEYHLYYLILSTILNSRLHLTFGPTVSGLSDSQMKIGFPTTWSSGTNPQ